MKQKLTTLLLLLIAFCFSGCGLNEARLSESITPSEIDRLHDGAYEAGLLRMELETLKYLSVHPRFDSTQFNRLADRLDFVRDSLTFKKK